MSYIERSFPAPHMDLPFFFNVHEAVGPDAPNRHADVLLVQIMLRGILNDPSHHYPETVPRSGIFDDVTARAIVYFQRKWRVMIRRELGMRDGAIDGRVSPARNIGYDRGPSVWTYTIVALNIEYKTYQPDRFRDLAAFNTPGS